MQILRRPREQLAVFFVLAGILIITVFGVISGTRLDQYQPKNEDEYRIVKLLIAFEKAKRQYDLETYLSCLSDEGEFMFGGALMVSKDELKKRLPLFWSDLASNRLNSVPSSREELNGNYLTGAFYDPVIEMGTRRAKAVLTFKTPVTKWKTKLFVNFQKDAHSWKITRFEWDMG